MENHLSVTVLPILVCHIVSQPARRVWAEQEPDYTSVTVQNLPVVNPGHIFLVAAILLINFIVKIVLTY